MTIQNYFNDTQDVLETTERLINREIYQRVNSFVNHSNFFDMYGYSPYEVLENAFNDSDEAKIEYLTNHLDNVKELKDLDYSQIQELADDNGFEPEYKEVFEWWLVTDYLADKLREIEEPVLVVDDFTIWGRTCTGQAIELDGTIQQIARNIVNWRAAQ